MRVALGVLFGLLLTGAASAQECSDPPSRVSDHYWDYIDACGCDQVDAPSRASLDYDRYLKACTRWREKNPQLIVVPSPAPDSTAPAAASPAPRPSASPKAVSKPKTDPTPQPSARPQASPSPKS